jgi:4'-phosphopantetheinyl transferase EntD
MLEAVLPAQVGFAETTARLRDVRLSPAASLALGAASPGRVAEFATGRHLARIVLDGLGFPGVEVGRGRNREPLWPPGVVGSVTHCDGYCATAATLAPTLGSLGIDAEPHAPLPGGVLERIALPEEAAWTRSHAGGGIHWDRLLFSAKEAVFKAWFPLTRRWLDFDEARISFSVPGGGDGPQTGRFHAALLVAAPRYRGGAVSGFSGRFVIDERHVVTAVCFGGIERVAGVERECDELEVSNATDILAKSVVAL